MQPYFDQLGALDAELAPYEQLKKNLAAARATYRTLVNDFIYELKKRCTILSKDERVDLVLELFVQDLQLGLDSAVREKQQELVEFVENLWDKYALSLTVLTENREIFSSRLHNVLQELRYE
ncbi:hypothetical protein FP507_07690 [Chlorobium phaeovibrioides]|uniref:Uncharacterized protein n=1 Tax=Chlorobium phaeovibrioides TaxID=1094 RepID=A0A5M8IC38_CHLPH|nr:hypothetical protein [Chlorobium phaeovibrioides]KAA6232941.1 hypothetical protein FP507_07690 [Chlorobium phaeovibrioides]